MLSAFQVKCDSIDKKLLNPYFTLISLNCLMHSKVLQCDFQGFRLNQLINSNKQFNSDSFKHKMRSILVLVIIIDIVFAGKCPSNTTQMAPCNCDQVSG